VRECVKAAPLRGTAFAPATGLRVGDARPARSRAEAGKQPQISQAHSQQDRCCAGMPPARTSGSMMDAAEQVQPVIWLRRKPGHSLTIAATGRAVASSDRGSPWRCRPLRLSVLPI